MTVSLYLLGPFLVTSPQDQALSLTSKKAQALLAYLATEGDRPHYRQALSGLLWPDRPDRASRNSLRQALWTCRRAIGDDTALPPYLLSSRDTIQINSEAEFSTDVAKLEKAVATVSRQQSCTLEPESVQALQSAISLYRGPFLEGFSLDDSAAFEEWALLKREQFGRQMMLALNALAEHHHERAEFSEALATVRRMIELDPWNENAHRRLWRLLVSTGQRTAALEAFRCFDKMIRRELGVSPDPETVRLYERIRDGIETAGLDRPMFEAKVGLGLRQATQKPVIMPAEGVSYATPLVAREQELALMQSHLAQALDSRGRVLFVTGEAGNGKTALMEEFGRRAMATEPSLIVAVGRCSAYSGAGDTHEPIRDILQTITGNLEYLTSPEQARRLQAVLPVTMEALAQQGPETVALIRGTNSLIARARACAPRDAAWLQDLKTLIVRAQSRSTVALPDASLCEQVVQLLRTVSRRSPLLLLLDDLQWADAPSLDMLFYLGRHLQGSRILVVAAYRPNEKASQSDDIQETLGGITDEFQRAWGDIRVDLSVAQGRHFVDSYLDIWPNRLESTFRATLTRHTGGNALFTVELVRAMQERGTLQRDGEGRWIEAQSLDWGKLPPRIEGSISQRIGQLSEQQRLLLETASVQGEDFYAEVLAQVVGLPVDTVIANLRGPLGRQAQLVTEGQVVRIGEGQLSRYRFRHGLFQNYLYTQLDQVTCARLNGTVGAAIEKLYGTQAGQHASQLARHFELAGMPDEAIRYLQEAGQQAAGVGEHVEAIACYERALDLLACLSESTKHDQTELSLQVALDRSLQYSKGWGAPERLGVCSRAYELGQRMGWSTPTRLDALQHSADLYAARGDYAWAVKLGHELVVAAQAIHDPLHAAAARIQLSRCYMLQGELHLAWETVSRVIEIGSQTNQNSVAEPTPDLIMQAEVIACWVRLAMGYMDQAQNHLQRAIDSANTGSSPQRIAWAQSSAGMFYAVGHQSSLAKMWAQQALRTTKERDIAEVQTWSAEILGWAESQSGKPRQGLDRLTAAIAVQRARGTESMRFGQEALMAEALLANDDVQKARDTLDEAIARAQSTGTRYYEAELWRLRGEVTRCIEPEIDEHAAQEAERCFQRAIEIAQRQGSRLWELRATVSLVRLWTQGDRGIEAKQALSAILSVFTEGHDTPELIQAHAYLGTSARSSQSTAKAES